MKDPIVKAVTDKFQQRSEVGIKKYGTTLDREDLTPEQWLYEFQCELMDGVLYCERLMKDLKKLKGL
jgi:hypothetical protein